MEPIGFFKFFYDPFNGNVRLFFSNKKTVYTVIATMLMGEGSCNDIVVGCVKLSPLTLYRYTNEPEPDELSIKRLDVKSSIVKMF